MAYHALLAPSSAYRYLNCPASAYEDKKHRDPDVELVEADQGTVAHHIANLWLTSVLTDFAEVKGNEYYVIDGNVIDARDFDTPPVGRTKHVVDQQMISALCTYTNAIMVAHAVLCENSENNGIGFEIKVPIGHITHEECAMGTADCGMYNETRIEIHDLKYGYSEVDAVDNPQLITYALGFTKHLTSTGRIDHRKLFDMEIWCVIHQPRVKDTPDVVKYTYADLAKWAFDNTDKFRRAYAFVLTAGAVAEPETYYTAGGHCQYCSYARHGCPTLMEHTMSVAKKAANIVREPLPKTSETLTLVEFFKLIPVLKTLGDKIELELLGKALRGEDVPGFKLGVGREGNRKWNAEEQIIVDKFVKLGCVDNDILYKKQFITPADMTQLVKAKAIPKDVATVIEEEYVSRTPGKPKLVPIGRNTPDFSTDGTPPGLVGLSTLE